MRYNAELKEMLGNSERTNARLRQELQKRKKALLNKECSKIVHQVTKKLKEERSVTFNFDVGPSDPENTRTMDRIIEGAMRHATSKNFTRQEAEEATKRYYITLKDENTRQMKGMKQRHLRLMRRNSRMDTKLRMRISGLKSKQCKLTPLQKQNAKAIMKMDYMSSDDDEVEKSEEGTEFRRVRPIPWESNEARHIKAILMDTHVQHVLGDRDRKKMQKLQRDENCSMSDRKCPDNAPSWACID